MELFNEIFRAARKMICIPTRHRYDILFNFLTKTDTQKRYLSIAEQLQGLSDQEAKWLLEWLAHDLAIYGPVMLIDGVMNEKEEEHEK